MSVRLSVTGMDAFGLLIRPRPVPLAELRGTLLGKVERSECYLVLFDGAETPEIVHQSFLGRIEEKRPSA